MVSEAIVLYGRGDIIVNCIYCDAELPDDADTCSVCGNFLKERPEKEQEIKRDIVDQVLDYVDIDRRKYFEKSFRSIQIGRGGGFNWAAFLFNFLYCMYRRQFSILFKYFKSPLIMIALTRIGYPGYLHLCKGSGINPLPLASMTIISIVWYIALSTWIFILCANLGYNFNELYFEKLKEFVSQQKDVRKYRDTSMFNFIMGLWILLFIGSAYSAIDPNAVKYYYEEEFGVQSDRGIGNNIQAYENNDYALRDIIEENGTEYIKGNGILYMGRVFYSDEGTNEFEEV